MGAGEARTLASWRRRAVSSAGVAAGAEVGGANSTVPSRVTEPFHSTPASRLLGPSSLGFANLSRSHTVLAVLMLAASDYAIHKLTTQQATRIIAEAWQVKRSLAG